MWVANIDPTLDAFHLNDLSEGVHMSADAHGGQRTPVRSELSTSTTWIQRWNLVFGLGGRYFYQLSHLTDLHNF